MASRGTVFSASMGWFILWQTVESRRIVAIFMIVIAAIIVEFGI